MGSLPNSAQLLSSIEEIGGCDGIVGPVLQLTGLVFGIEAVVHATRKDLSKFFSDSNSAQDKQNVDAFKKQFATHIASLNPFDDAFKASSDNTVKGSNSPLSSRASGVDFFSDGSSPATFANLPFDQALAGSASNFSPMAQTVGSPTQDGDCAGSVIGGLTQVNKTDLLNTSAAFRKTAGNIAGIGMTLARNPALAVNSIFSTTTNLLNSLAARETALIQLKTLIEKATTLTLQIEEADRRNNYKEQTYAAQRYVDTAISQINELLDNLALSGGYDSTVLSEIKSSINSARKSLEVSPVFPDVTSTFLMMALSGLLVLIDQQVQALKKSDENVFEIFENLSVFSSSLTGNFKVNSHFGGMFSVIRCGLQKISKKMSETANRDNLVLYLFQFQQWRIMLSVYHEMMNVAGKDLTPILAADFESETGKLAIDIEKAANQVKAFFAPESIGSVIASVRNFLSTVRTAMKFEVKDSVVTGSRDAAISQINTAINQGLSATNLLNPILKKVPPGVVESTKVLSDVVSFFPQMYAMANALAKVDWKQFFNADAMSSSLNRMMAKYLEAAAKCCDGNPTSKTLATSRRLREEAALRNQKGAVEDSDTERLSAASKFQELNSLTDIQDLKTTVQRIQSLLKSTCFGDVVSSSNQSLIFT